MTSSPGAGSPSGGGTATQPAFPWEHLLDLVAERRVIPVVGNDLVLFEQDGAARTLEAHCAGELARRMGREDAAGIDSFARLAVAHASSPGRSRSLQEVAFDLGDYLCHEMAIPPTLRHLAELPFPLYLTTTFDPLNTDPSAYFVTSS